MRLALRTCRPRRLTRYTTRMLGGARRPPKPNYLSIACRAFDALIKIDEQLGPHLEQQEREREHQLWMQEVDAALARVYGPRDPADAPPPANFAPTRKEMSQLLREEKLLLKTELLLASLQTKLRPKSVNKR